MNKVLCFLDTLDNAAAIVDGMIEECEKDGDVAQDFHIVINVNRGGAECELCLSMNIKEE